MHRRTLLGAAGALMASGLAGVASISPAARAAGLTPLGDARPFDFAWLKGVASNVASRPYEAHGKALPPEVAALDWDQYQAIRFKPDHTVWNDRKLQFRIGLFHLGLYYKRPVRMFEVTGGKAQELAYDPAMFDYGKSGLDGAKQPRDLGFAGFRVNSRRDNFKSDVAAFLGASYFRAVGAQGQYGLSARGLAIDTALQQREEEFPDFTDFYFEAPDPKSSTVVVYALLDSPSVAGAYRFAITPGEPLLMDIDCALYPRKAIERLGIAPCTSMYQVGENDRRMATDWRPEIHDSDGLSMHSGKGEWIWRPLTNPAKLSFNSFGDRNPLGFGLLQRDRDFDHYQDDGVFYDRRPSLWVEPKGDWGDGAVQLVQIPTVDETLDNIVAFWNPAQKLQPGQEALFGYRLYWGSKPHMQSPLATCVATRTGIGGVVGKKREYYAWRFAVDFAGGPLARLDWGKAKVEPVITLSSGRAEVKSVRPLASVRGARAMFDVVPGESLDPITVRLYLKMGDQSLSETWLYEWVPPGLEDRKV
ncbi:glucan biosynthesis protein [Variovorax sp. OV329]|uniref:glucan biosynthesis protein n=1 Tax=Variovorax sp. OV329 TaxID=1882825 RepID=UPI0008F0E1CE|nr:glucan biosynthesis protein D [Variovorax sp. OV329]SFM57298.1 glucans biosynthesis protein [Variovorax sp. OV329]